MQYRVEVIYKQEAEDPGARVALGEALDLGIRAIEGARALAVYIVDGELNVGELRRLAETLFLDPVLQHYRVCGLDEVVWPYAEGPGVHTIEVARKAGVMDPVQMSAIKGAADLGLDGKVDRIRTARKYLMRGDLTHEQLMRLALKALANTSIEDIHVDAAEVEYPVASPTYDFERVTVAIREAPDSELERISREGVLSLTLQEMKTVQAHFAAQDRDPTDLELEILAQMWSEHCVHKTFRGHVTYEGPVPPGWEDRIDAHGRLVLDNMLKATVARATNVLAKPWCVSVFKDNAGVIEFGDGYDVCFKVETHNHPSAIDPYGGANTGIGGVIRDPMGTGLGARPILNTDVFCFGPPDMAEEDVPAGALHPLRVMKGVVAGVRDYGNRMGIPTANGAVFFDERYTGNCLVYCGNIGLIPEGLIEKAARPGDHILVVGGRTGRDGIHGATFSSVELDRESEEVNSGAVQIGNAITEKKVLDTMLQARDRGLYTCVTDCGAGGLSCAVGEMGAETGADVEIADVPLKYDGLSYTEIWISEAQERMVFSVPPENLDEILAIFAAEDVEATVIGRYTGDKMLRVKYKGNLVAEIPMEFVHDGMPRFAETAVWAPLARPDPLVLGSLASGTPRQQQSCIRLLEGADDYTPTLMDILAAPNVRSKEWIIRQYDHEVQGQTVIKPLVGVANDGPGDGCVIAPLLGSNRGIAVACGLNPKYGDIDTYHGAASAIDEALRNIVSVGGTPSRTAILDNFCWGNTRKPEQLGTLVRAALACYDCAMGFGVPFISGKDSLNNEYNTGTEVIAIPATLLISAISVMDDVRTATTMDLKAPGNLLYMVGVTYPELGGSHYYDLVGLIGMTVPQVRIDSARRNMEALCAARAAGLVRSCHDLSEGGLAVAAAEMAFAGGLGLSVDLRAVTCEGGECRRDDVRLFSESNSRFLVEVTPENAQAFEARMRGAASKIGEVNDSDRFTVTGLAGSAVIDGDLATLKAAWQTPLVPAH